MKAHASLRSCAELFEDSQRGLLHTTSAVRYPVFVRMEQLVRCRSKRSILLERISASETIKIGRRPSHRNRTLGCGFIAFERLRCA